MKDWVEANPKPKTRGERTQWKEEYYQAKAKYKEHYDEMPKVYFVNLEKKIIVFTDQPHPLILQHLRSLLSHDRKIRPVFWFVQFS